MTKYFIHLCQLHRVQSHGVRKYNGSDTDQLHVCISHVYSCLDFFILRGMNLESSVDTQKLKTTRAQLFKANDIVS